MNIIFLDFDGPLFPNRLAFAQGSMEESKSKRNFLNLGDNAFFWKMDEVAIGMLNKLNSKFNIEFVISSSLAKKYSQNIIKEWLDYNGFKGAIHKDWSSSLNNDVSRLDEIESWLKRNSINDNYVIIDDEVSAPEMKNISLVKNSSIIIEKIILISPENGILMSHYQKIENLLKIS